MEIYYFHEEGISKSTLILILMKIFCVEQGALELG